MSHYVTNKDFLAALVARQQALLTNPELQISNYIGECILKICTNLAHKNNFNGYSYKEEMVSDAIENCLAVVDKFNPEKSDNPFAYFTQCAYFAFIRRIHKEKKQQEIKGALLQDMIDEGSFELQEGDDSSDFNMSFLEQAKATSFLPIKQKQKKENLNKGLLEFCED